MSSNAFQQALPFILRWEGGYVNHPDDHGGPTNKGVTQKVYDRWRVQKGLAARDVREIEDAEVGAIYESGYWLPAKCDRLPAGLDLLQFDTAVNMGPGRAVRFLQTAVGATPDGAFGSGTQTCLDACDRGAAMVAYCNAREAFYKSLVDNDAKQQVFLKGWMNRLNALRKQVGLPVAESIGGEADFGERAYIERVRDVGEGDGDELRIRAEGLRARLHADPDALAIEEARALLEPLRNERSFEALAGLCEALCRVDPIDPPDPTTRRLYGQALIETGATFAAIALLRQLQQTVPRNHPESVEASGLIGRAYKQMFFDAADPRSAPARRALASAVEAYRAPYDADPQKNTWHGVNLLALVCRSRREGWHEIAPATDPASLARQLQATLEAIPPGQQDDWHLPTLAEVTLALTLATGDLTPVERLLHAYIAQPQAKAFQVASTLRQFVEVWGLESLNEETPGIALKGAALGRARALVEILRARLAQLRGGEWVTLGSRRVLPGLRAGKTQAISPPSDGQLEAILGVDGPATYRWWQAGLNAARSVGVVRQRLGRRTGSGFLVNAADFGLTEPLPPGAALFVTNYHVVNAEGAVAGSLRPDQAEVVFEAEDASVAYKVTRLLWSSPVEQHDCALLQLEGAPATLSPLSIQPELPRLPPPEVKKRPLVYIVGYPGGRELSFSFQDNEVLDHEGPTDGRPKTPGVVRVHYRAPTEGGSSGSPVFDQASWSVVALHHSGGQMGTPRLNGATGTYAANEGLAMSALREAARAALQARGTQT